MSLLWGINHAACKIEVVSGNKNKGDSRQMIKTVVRMKNDMVMVFDARGEQITAYQGQYDHVREKILENAPSDAVFVDWFGSDAIPEAVSREDW